MNKQRKVIITTTYNEMGIIIDTKAEEVAQPNLQQTCNNLATDCISRSAAIDACTKVKVGAFPHDAGVNNSIKALKALPSAQPQREKGNWVCIDGINYECDQCGCVLEDWIQGAFYNYCPNCGADMRGGEQDEA